MANYEERMIIIKNIVKFVLNIFFIHLLNNIINDAVELLFNINTVEQFNSNSSLTYNYDHLLEMNKIINPKRILIRPYYIDEM